MAFAITGALAKVEWLLAKARREDVWVRTRMCAALLPPRVTWSGCSGCGSGGVVPWGTAPVLQAVLRQAYLASIQRMEQEGGYLPPECKAVRSSHGAVCSASRSLRDRVAKLRWLAGQGGPLRGDQAMLSGAERGKLEALQLTSEHRPTFANADAASGQASQCTARARAPGCPTC